MASRTFLENLSDILAARQNSLPCPGGNGTTFTTPQTQQFSVICGSRSNNSVAQTLPATTFSDCMSFCSTAHSPRCGGVSYTSSTKNCQIFATLTERDLQSSPGEGLLDSAIAQFPGASSDCRSLGAQAVAGTMTFNTQCGQVIDGADMSQQYAPTFTTCLGMCASAPGCNAVSFEATQFSGFANCYLKSSAAGAGVSSYADFSIDSAVVVSDSQGAQPVVASPAPAQPVMSASSVPSQAVATITYMPSLESTSTMLMPTPSSVMPSIAAAADATSVAAPVPTMAAVMGGGGTVSLQVWVATLVSSSVAIMAAICAAVLVFRRRRQQHDDVETKNESTYQSYLSQDISPPSFREQEVRESKEPIGNVTVVSTVGPSSPEPEESARDPDGRREWWKQGSSSPRASATDI